MNREITASDTAESPRLREHPQRHLLAGEAHARPYEQLQAPVRASLLAVTTGEQAAKADRAHLHEICGLYGVEPPPIHAIHFAADLGKFRLRWERHAEFASYTFLRSDPFEEPFAETALDLVPKDWLGGLPGQLLVAAHAAIEKTERSPEDLARLFEGPPAAGSRVMGAAAIAADFRLHADGCARYLVRDDNLTLGQAGRLMQRLIEIETYRLMALLALPVAREIAPQITRHGRALAEIIGKLANRDTGDTDRALLDRLTQLAADSEQLASASSYRFSAARAYWNLVSARIEELREERVPGLQTLKEFMDRRLAPAMATCESTQMRLENLSKRVTRAGALLRTRVDIELEEKNRDLLKSMNRRAQLQLRLQETVEGLSVVAISYYLIGLAGYAAKGLKAAGLPINPDIAVVIAIPLVLGLVWMGVRRVRRALKPGEEE